MNLASPFYSFSRTLIGHPSAASHAEGRYCLNDLHRAAGASLAHRPGIWFKNAKTKELVTELEKDGISSFSQKRGRTGGTYVCKELVYAYAMWISLAEAPYWRADGG